MIATIVHVWVKPEFLEKFIAVTKLNHQGSVKEPGNIRFDIIQDVTDPCKFVFYEVYRKESDIMAHRETSHYLDWREKVASWMAKPREAVKHVVLFPADDE